MATITDTIKTYSTPETAKQREQYTFLLNAAKAKMAVFKAEIDQMYLNPEAVGKVQVIGKRAIAYKEQYHVGLGSKSEVLTKIGASVGSFLTGKTREITDGILNIASIAVDAILGDTSIGEVEDKTWFVIPQHNAVIRIDAKFWRYNFSAKGIITDTENVFCYVCAKSVVDYKALSDAEFIYLISENIGDEPEKVKSYLKELKEIWDSLKSEEPKRLMERLESKYKSVD